MYTSSFCLAFFQGSSGQYRISSSLWMFLNKITKRRTLAVVQWCGRIGHGSRGLMNYLQPSSIKYKMSSVQFFLLLLLFNSFLLTMSKSKTAHEVPFAISSHCSPLKFLNPLKSFPQLSQAFCLWGNEWQSVLGVISLSQPSSVWYPPELLNCQVPVENSGSWSPHVSGR